MPHDLLKYLPLWPASLSLSFCSAGAITTLNGRKKKQKKQTSRQKLAKPAPKSSRLPNKQSLVLIIVVALVAVAAVFAACRLGHKLAYELSYSPARQPSAHLPHTNTRFAESQFVSAVKVTRRQ